jgi:hypothetical protein
MGTFASQIKTKRSFLLLLIQYDIDSMQNCEYYISHSVSLMFYLSIFSYQIKDSYTSIIYFDTFEE